MASAQIFHLLLNPPVASAPDPSTIISATTPDYGVVTTCLLDPASNPVGQAQVAHGLSANFLGTKNIVLGRWITRQLPAQVIGAGTWELCAVYRQTLAATGSNIANKLWGFTVAQWRAGTGVVARFLDAPTGGTSYTALSSAQEDIAAFGAQAGGALTLQQNDQIILEVWSQHVLSVGAQTIAPAILLGGRGQYYPVQGTYLEFTDTDAVLVAPAAIVYQ